MKKAAIVLTICLLVVFQGAALAQIELVLSITGEDVSDVVSRFNRSQSDYRVVVQSHKYRNWRYAINQFRFNQESAAKGAGNRVIDIAFVDNNWLPGMIQDRWLADITGKIEKEGNFIDGLSDAAIKDGRLYALPFSNKGQVLFYRRDLHEKHGLPPPRTLKELERNALVLMEREKLDHGMTIHYSAIHLDVLPFLWSNGGGIIEDGKVIFHHPSNIETLTYLQALARKRVLPAQDTFSKLKGAYSNAKKLFMEGKSAYLLTWNNRVADVENSPLAGKFGILPIPPLNEGQPWFSVIGSWYFAVNTFSAHKEGALRFMNYFFKDDVQLDLALKSSAFIPATKSVYANFRLKTHNRYMQDLEAAMGNMRHRLKHPQEPEISQVIANTIKEILVEGKPVKVLLDIAQKRIASICGRPKE